MYNQTPLRLFKIKPISTFRVVSVFDLNIINFKQSSNYCTSFNAELFKIEYYINLEKINNILNNDVSMVATNNIAQPSSPTKYYLARLFY